MRTVQISEEIYNALGKLANPFESLDECINRIITTWTSPKESSVYKTFFKLNPSNIGLRSTIPVPRLTKGFDTPHVLPKNGKQKRSSIALKKSNRVPRGFWNSNQGQNIVKQFKKGKSVNWIISEVQKVTGVKPSQESVYKQTARL